MLEIVLKRYGTSGLDVDCILCGSGLTIAFDRWTAICCEDDGDIGPLCDPCAARNEEEIRETFNLQAQNHFDELPKTVLRICKCVAQLKALAGGPIRTLPAEELQELQAQSKRLKADERESLASESGLGSTSTESPFHERHSKGPRVCE